MLGLQLMLVGMVTVFAILLTVIFGGRLLVSLVNRLLPSEALPQKAEKEEDVPMDVLQQAVNQITGGKGRIVKVSKINQCQI